MPDLEKQAKPMVQLPFKNQTGPKIKLVGNPPLAADLFIEPVRFQDLPGTTRKNKEFTDGDDGRVQIKERSLTLFQTVCVLLVQFIAVVVLAFPWSFAILGLAGGLITCLIVGLTTVYSVHILWRFCMLHRDVRDLCDLAYHLFGQSRIAWYMAFIGLAANNLGVMAVHVNGAQTAISTLGHTFCSVFWGLMAFGIMYSGSLVRSFRRAGPAAALSAGTMFACFILVIVGHIVQGKPNQYEPGDSLEWTMWAPKGTSAVKGINAVLNILYSFIGHPLIPSYIGDMKDPMQFPKALYITMAIEIVLFTILGAVVYVMVGTDLTVSPAYGSLREDLGKAAAGLALPTIASPLISSRFLASTDHRRKLLQLIVGSLFSLVTSRAVFFQIYKEGSIHRRRHTRKGWLVWFGIVTVGWIVAFIVAEAVPFFGDLLSLIASLFDSWFGFILWPIAYWSMNRHKKWSDPWHLLESTICMILLITGIFLFTAGSYASIKSIRDNYAAGPITRPFTCNDTGFKFNR